MWFGLLRVRSPLLAESLLISVPGLLRWFTSPSITSVAYFIQLFGWCNRLHRVTPFGYLRINGYVLLHAAFRSLSRPSSSYSSTGIHHKPMFAWPYYLFLYIYFTQKPLFSCQAFKILARLCRFVSFYLLHDFHFRVCHLRFPSLCISKNICTCILQQIRYQLLGIKGKERKQKK